MHKYKIFFLLFCGFILLLLWSSFPILFENNDDQVMFAVSSGIFTHNLSPNLVLSHVFIGKLLNTLFAISASFNFYTLYLELVLASCFFGICYLIFNEKSIRYYQQIGYLFYIFSGFLVLLVVKIQFTTVAIFCVATALLGLQSHLNTKTKFLFSFIFVLLACLIRKESFYIFLLLVIPVFFEQTAAHKKTMLLFISVTIFSFLVLNFINSQHPTYKTEQTYYKIETIDRIAAKPVSIDTIKIKQYGFIPEEIQLIQSWLLLDDGHFNQNKLGNLAQSIKANRTTKEFQSVIKKLLSDERYSLFLLGISLLFVWYLHPPKRKFVLFNMVAVIGFFLYLLYTSRLPFRVSFPVLTYLNILNVFYIIKSEKKRQYKNVALAFFLVLSSYKLYCTLSYYSIHQQRQHHFEQVISEINTHPNSLFIALDGFPFQDMNAWKSPESFFKHHNILFNGWYAGTPDYTTLMQQHQLRNLTIDLLKKPTVLFLTNDAYLLQLYQQTMLKKYKIKCHFEPVNTGYSAWQPKRLIFEN